VRVTIGVLLYTTGSVLYVLEVSAVLLQYFRATLSASPHCAPRPPPAMWSRSKAATLRERVRELHNIVTRCRLSPCVAPSRPVQHSWLVRGDDEQIKAFAQHTTWMLLQSIGTLLAVSFRSCTCQALRQRGSPGLCSSLPARRHFCCQTAAKSRLRSTENDADIGLQSR
jgi:hypothetical protein